MLRRHLPTVSAALLLFVAPVFGSSQDDPERRVMSLLAVYDAGHDSDIESMLAAQPKGPLAAALRRYGDRWIAGPAETMDRRRFVAGAVALEIVAAGLRDEWKDVVDVIEWACKHVMASAPGSASELTWHIGSIALLQDGAGLMRTQQFVGDHIEQHSLKRLPESPRVRLGFAVDQERDVYKPAIRPGQPEVSFEATSRFRVQEAAVLERYNALLSSEVVGAEAQLRLGAFYLRTGSVDKAFAQLQPLAQSNDRFIGYVSAFLMGEGLRGQGRHREAAASYRLALTHIPNVMSASLGLSASLAATDDMTAALAAMTGAASSSAPLDPWRIFAFGEGRNWIWWRDALRKELKR